MRWWGGRRLLVPEVIQTSSTDCGPACLTSFLAGFGVQASYGRLRDICYTDVDGTSIDDLEDVAVRLGLDAHQAMVPREHLLLEDAQTLPAIVVLALPAGVAHFVVLWRKLGAWVQIMDPSGGRRLVHQRHLQEMLYVHRAEVPAEQWHRWAQSEGFIGPLSGRMLRVGLSGEAVVTLLHEALEDDSWRPLAALEAMTRQLESIIAARGPAAGREAAGLVEGLAGEVPLHEQADFIPDRFFSVQAADPDDAGSPMLRVEGAVLITATGLAARGHEPEVDGVASRLVRRLWPGVGRGVAAAVETSTAVSGAPPAGPGAPAQELYSTRAGVLRQLLRYLRADGMLGPAAMAGAAMIAGLIVAFEAVLFKGLLELGHLVHGPGQRAAAVLAVAVFAVLTLVVDLRLAQGVRTLGRRMEARLRIAFLRKLTRLPDGYFSRRLTSDLTLRIHSVVQIRGVPHVGESILRSLFSLLFITAGIIWVDPGCAPYALVAAAVALGLPALSQSRLGELQLSVATYQGGLSRYFLDALLGAMPLRTHDGHGVFRREHDRMLDRWARGRRSLIRTSVLVQTLITATGMLMSGIILHVHLARAPDTSSVLLLLFWSQQLPLLGGALAQSMLEYPARRAAAARLFEPINTESEPAAPEGGSSRPAADEPAPGAALGFYGVQLERGRTRILDGVDFELPAGCHCAVVGASGAGKSSLVGLLLGWYAPTEGRVEVDGRPLDPAARDRLREQTAWVDPQVQLWNRSLLHNVTYGTGPADADLAEVIDAAGLRSALETLPAGFGSPLGEDGGSLSEGEGQRVRIARALSKRQARLVLLDEPFRGLARPTRAQALARLRAWWSDRTMLCVTHDVSETLGFDRVLVLEGGRVVEQGRPEALARRPDSAYRALLDAEHRVRGFFDRSPVWTRWTMVGGRLRGPEPGDADGPPRLSRASGPRGVGTRG